MTVKGFSVSGQGRSRIRKPLTGTYKGYAWTVEGVRAGVFEWLVKSTVGLMSGFTPLKSTVETALIEIRESVTLMEDTQHYGRTVTNEMAEQLNRLNKWKRAAIQGKLKIALKHKRGKAVGIYYSVEEMD